MRVMSIGNLFLYIHLLKGGLCDYACNQSIYLFIYSYSHLFFSLCMKYVFREIIRILSFFSVYVSCIVEMIMWNVE